MHVQKMKHMLLRLLPMGGVATSGGVLIGVLVSREATGRGWEVLPVVGGVGGLMTGAFFWWLLIVRGAQYTIRRGIVAGVLTGVVGHYVVGYVLLLAAFLSYRLTDRPVSSLGEQPVDPVFGFVGAAGLALWSLVLFGWLTVPIGALSGAAIAALQRRCFARLSDLQTERTA